MKKAVSQQQQEHNVTLWYATKSQELITGYIKGFTSYRTAQELLEDRAFNAFIRTNIAKDFVWKIFAKRHILSAARNMGLYGKNYDGRWAQFTLTPEDACVQSDIIENIEWQERYQAFKLACECLEPMERKVLSYYCNGVSLTEYRKNLSNTLYDIVLCFPAGTGENLRKSFPAGF